MKNLQDKQRQLDHIINQNMKEKISKELLIKCKTVSLDIELAEFMNELEIFKFWKKHKGKGGELEEFADCLHFILSIANELRVECKLNYKIVEPSKDILKDYLYIKEKLAVFNLDRDKIALLQLFNTLFKIAKALGWTWEDIENSYIEKWKVNIERQKNNY